MARPKRTPIQRESDLVRIAKMYLEQMTQREIAAELGISQRVVHRDLAEVRRRWRESSIIDMNEARVRELARVDQLERMYRDGYERSCQEKIVTRVEREGNTIKTIVQREQLIGNAAFLNGILHCIDQRCKILDIYKMPALWDWRSAVEARGLDAGEVFEQMVDAAKRILGGGKQ
jgi:hypothetical protein